MALMCGGERGVLFGTELGDLLRTKLGDLLGNLLGTAIGDLLGDELGYLLGTVLGDLLTMGDLLVIEKGGLATSFDDAGATCVGKTAMGGGDVVVPPS